MRKSVFTSIRWKKKQEALLAVTYYGNEIKLVVTVVNDGAGKVRVAAVHTEAEKAGGFDSITKGEGGKSDTFANTYKANELEVSKDVTGNLGR